MDFGTVSITKNLSAVGFCGYHYNITRAQLNVNAIYFIIVPFVVKKYDRQRRIAGNLAPCFCGGKRAAPIVTHRSDLSSAALCGGGCRGAVYSHSVIADFVKLFLKAVDQARPTGVRDNSKPAVAGGAKHDIAARCIRRLQSKRFMFFDKS